MPGCQKLTPLSSADAERWPKKVAKAITEVRKSKLGNRFLEAIATSRPYTCPGPMIVDRPLKNYRWTQAA